MKNDKYFFKHKEDDFSSLDYKSLQTLRENASEDGDLILLLDIATYRFLHGCDAEYIYLLPEMFYLYGKANKLDELRELLDEYGWTLMTLPPSCVQKAQNMLLIGTEFPYLSEAELTYLEELWCDSNSFEWMDVIMYDSYLLPRVLNRFDKSLLNQVHTDFSDAFLLQVYDCFDVNEGEPSRLYCYDKKTNTIIEKEFELLGEDEYVIHNSKRYNEMNDYLTHQYGDECADFFAQNLMFLTEDVEEFKKSTFCSVSPMRVIEVAEQYFKNKEDVLNLKKWFAYDFLYRCNHPDEYKLI